MTAFCAIGLKVFNYPLIEIPLGFSYMANSLEIGAFRFFGPGIMKNYPIFLIFVSYVFQWMA